jgi:alpha/beta superfamily hydrolase
LDEKEAKFSIPGPAGNLEAAFSRGDAAGTLSDAPRLAILCHPHPQHGGTMDNKVVTTLMRCYRDLGVHVLRFNFRGVGASEGEFDNAQGELADLLAVVGSAQHQWPACATLLAGFSFGSSIAARASYQVPHLQHLTLVAPPVERYEYDRDGAFSVPACIVQGDQDERVMATGVYEWAARLLSPTEVIRYPEAGHFFHGYLSALKTDLTAVLLRQLANS